MSGPTNAASDVYNFLTSFSAGVRQARDESRDSGLGGYPSRDDLAPGG